MQRVNIAYTMQPTDAASVRASSMLRMDALLLHMARFTTTLSPVVGSFP